MQNFKDTRMAAKYMIQRLTTLLIFGLCLSGLLALSFPTQATQIAYRVMGTIGSDIVPQNIILDIQKPETPIDTATDQGKPVVQSRPVTKGALSIENIIDATNKERIKEGLTPFQTNNLLIASAKVKVDDMFARQYFEHAAPTGEGVSDLVDDTGYTYIVVGENLALGNFDTAEELVTAWMNSPGHRANILNKNYKELGVYAARSTYAGRTTWLAVQHFGTPRSICPGINESLKKSIDITNAELKKKEQSIITMRQELESWSGSQGEDYRDLIDDFNKLVNLYNTELATSQKKITQYNVEVKAFNNCLSVYQK